MRSLRRVSLLSALLLICVMAVCTIKPAKAYAESLTVNSVSELKEAVANFKAGDVIYLDSDLTFAEGDSAIMIKSFSAEQGRIVVDLNGHCITSTVSDNIFLLEENGELSIINSSSNVATLTASCSLYKYEAEEAPAETLAVVTPENLQQEGSSLIVLTVIISLLVLGIALFILIKKNQVVDAE